MPFALTVEEAEISSFDQPVVKSKVQVHKYTLEDQMKLQNMKQKVQDAYKKDSDDMSWE